MPNIKSAMKRVKVSEKKHAANSSQKSALRKQIKSARLALESKAADAAEKVKTATVALDVAASKGLIHKNKAARDKSRLMSALNKMA
ncbi:MAG: 30S ribosomal protein S20 [Clostridia bacterium]